MLDGLDPVAEYEMWNGQRAEFYRGDVEAFSPVPMLLAMRHFPEGTEGQTYWVHLDGRGSVAGLTKHQGPVGAGGRLPLPLRRLRPGAPGPGQLDRSAQPLHLPGQGVG